MPRTAALPRAEAWVKAPTMDLSFIKILVNAQMPINMMVVPIIQKMTNFGSKASLIGVVAMSLNNRTGKDTLKTNLLMISTKFSLNIFFCIKNQPRTITRKTGSVAFRLNIKLLIG